MYDNYPPGAAHDPSAPYNQVDVPEKDFDVTCSQSLSRTAVVTTNNYTPGASGVDYEPDDEGGCCACGWQDDDDTSDTNWSQEYEKEHLTPIELIKKFKSLLLDIDSPELRMNPCFQHKQYYISECEGWKDDETEYIVES
jgi:hypothetical protein